MPAGRRKKSAGEQARRGNPGKRPAKKKTAARKQAAPEKPAAKKPATKKPAKKPATKQPAEDAPPVWLGVQAKQKWREVYPLFARRGVITELDRDALALYCDAWQQLHDADTVLARAGSYFETEKGYVGIHPAVARRNKAIDHIRKIGEQLGLTPNSRRGLDLTNTDVDPLDEFLS